MKKYFFLKIIIKYHIVLLLKIMMENVQLIKFILISKKKMEVIKIKMKKIAKN